MTEFTPLPYDAGYASTRVATWGAATIKLHLGWLSTQLRLHPADEFRRGRHDALCDLLVRYEPLPAGGG